jgi:hypothetical protein
MDCQELRVIGVHALCSISAVPRFCNQHSDAAVEALRAEGAIAVADA